MTLPFCKFIFSIEYMEEEIIEPTFSEPLVEDLQSIETVIDEPPKVPVLGAYGILNGYLIKY